MLSKSFHWLLWAEQTPNSLCHQLFRRGGWLGDVTDVCRRECGWEESGAAKNFQLAFLSVILSSTLFYLRRGRDGTGPAGGDALNIALKLQNQTIRLRHALFLNTITWRLWMDNPLKPDQRKSEFWSGLQCVFTCKKELIWVAVYMTTACNPVRKYSASCHKDLGLSPSAWKTVNVNVRMAQLMYLCTLQKTKFKCDLGNAAVEWWRPSPQARRFNSGLDWGFSPFLQKRACLFRLETLNCSSVWLWDCKTSEIIRMDSKSLNQMNHTALLV